jgi:polysaccharide pyruvyl transferase CsaB
MPTILIGGYYGAGNLGDEAILASMLGDLRSRRSDLSFIITSWNPEKTAREFNVEAIRWKDINGLLDAGLRADLIILGGGGLFFDYWGIDPDTYLRKTGWDITAYGSLPLLAKLLDIPCMIYGVGIGPFKSELARQHTCLAFERSQVATLRDVQSFELLKQIGFNVENQNGPHVEILPDPVFSLTTTPQDEAQATDFLKLSGINSDAKLLGVSLRYWAFGVSLEEWLPIIANGLGEFLNQNDQVQVILMPFQVLETAPDTNDAVILAKLAELINKPERMHLVKDSLTPGFAQALIKRCTVILGMRLHSLIMGINAGVPLVGLPYDPKVRSVMKLAGLEKFCTESLTPQASDLTSKIQQAWKHSQELHLKMQPLRAELSQGAQKHAVLALDLLSHSHRSELQFSQEFALQQTRLLAQADEKLDTLLVRSSNLEIRSTRLDAIEASRVWQAAKIYNRWVERPPLKYVHRFFDIWLKEGLKKTFVKAYKKLRVHLQPERPVFKDAKEGDAISFKVVESVVHALNDRALEGIAIVTSAFVFDELYNQRIINFSKFLSARNWGVIYIAWRWSKQESMPSIGDEVYKNVFQIPVDMFLENLSVFSQVQNSRKYFFIEFPHPDFLMSGLKLRRNGFGMVYEIIDEWEEFHKVGQAIWFNKSVENALVTNANFLTAVSSPLIEKFSGLRQDIHPSPNGYTPFLLGENYHNISRERQIRKNEIHLGYFGHLTEAWFDWDFLLKVLELANKKSINLNVHLIGYGEPDLRIKLAKYRDRVMFHGKVHPSELYKYVKEWDAALICFKKSRLSEAVDPIKIYEYLYFGLPVIAKGISHLKEFPATQVVISAQQALDALVALHNEPEQAARINWLDGGAVAQMLAKSTWEKRFSKLLEILENEKWMSL